VAVLTDRPPAEKNGTAQTILLVTGISGAGKSTALRALEDLGWEVVDNLPIALVRSLLASPPAISADGETRPLAVGIDSRTRGFSADGVVRAIKRLRERGGHSVATLFIDCSGAELERRFAETRRRHPMAEDRPIADGVARERELIDPLRRWAEYVIDTSNLSAHDLKADVRQRFARADGSGLTITILSFGFARGMPRTADLVFDVRYLRNPYWDENLRGGSGQDPEVIDYIRADEAYESTIGSIERLLVDLLPRYCVADRAYLTIAFGCTGGRHRSVHVAERIAHTLQRAGYAPHVSHRNLTSPHHETLEGRAPNA
jgi:RNase adapter protein RapZ